MAMISCSKGIELRTCRGCRLMDFGALDWGIQEEEGRCRACRSTLAIHAPTYESLFWSVVVTKEGNQTADMMSTIGRFGINRTGGFHPSCRNYNNQMVSIIDHRGLSLARSTSQPVRSQKILQLTGTEMRSIFCTRSRAYESH